MARKKVSVAVKPMASGYDKPAVTGKVKPVAAKPVVAAKKVVKQKVVR